MTRRLIEFSTKDLSSLYFEVAKDPLYAGSINDQRQILNVMDQVLQTMTSIIAPIMPHLAEDIAWYRTGATKDPSASESVTMPSFFQQGWNKIPDIWNDPKAEADMKVLLRIRSDVHALVSQAKEKQFVKSTPETAVQIFAPADSSVSQVVVQHQMLLADLFGVASIEVVSDVAEFQQSEQTQSGWSVSVAVHGTPIQLRMHSAPNHKCPRCWKHHSINPDALCSRCEVIVSS